MVGLLDPLDVAAVRFDGGLWDWLALHMIDVIALVGQAGSQKLKKGPHYSLEEGNHQRRYRHLLYSAWFLVREHGDAVRFMLAGEPATHGEAAEQLAAYQDVVGSRSIVGAGALLYWDPDRAEPKKDFRGKGRGSVRRFPTLVRQLLLTYDLPAMTPQRIVDLLPSEFDRWRRPSRGARPRAGRAGRDRPMAAQPPLPR